MHLSLLFSLLFLFANIPKSAGRIMIFPDDIVTNKRLVTTICQGDTTDYNLTWYKNGTVIENNDYYSLHKISSTHLQLEIVVNEHTVGVYKCVSNHNNKAGIFSLKSNDLLVKFMNRHPSVTVDFLSNAFLPCQYVSKNGGVVVMWQKNYLPLDKNRTKKEPNGIIILSAVLSDAGIYKCIVISEGRFISSIDVELIIEYGPVILFEPHYLRIGTDENITCQIKSNKNIEIEILDQYSRSLPFQTVQTTNFSLYNIVEDTVSFKNVQKNFTLQLFCVAYDNYRQTKLISIFTSANVPEELRLSISESTVKWERPVSNGADIKFYVVEATNSLSSKNITVKPPLLQIKLESILVSGKYNITVWAVNGVGYSAPASSYVDVEKTLADMKRTKYTITGVTTLTVVVVLVVLVLFGYKKGIFKAKVHPLNEFGLQV